MAPSSESKSPPPSSVYPGIWKYPTNRDVPFRMTEDWLEAKRMDDDIDSLWRVHNKLYNLKPFIKKHPGGSEWLELTRGTDITEAFESSHVTNISSVESTLAKYYVGNASHPRISPYTFKSDGFYLRLKRKCEPIFKRVGTGPTHELLRMQDSLVLGYFLSAGLGAMWNSYLLNVLAGLLLGFSTIGAHNFFHIRENWRRYYFDLSLLSSSEWRVCHALSHHLYPNTVMDISLTMFPTWEFCSNRPKHWVQRNLSILYSHLLYAIGFWMEAASRLYHIIRGRKTFQLENLLVLLELLVLILVGGGVASGIKSWVVIHTVSSYCFLQIGAHVSHHHPDIFHDGDEPLQDPDFGIGQLDATRDRAEDLFQNTFISLITFGNHPLHHLFPTVCHSKLEEIREVFEQTVQQFQLDYPGIPQLELYYGLYEQLARVEPKTRSKQD